MNILCSTVGIADAKRPRQGLIDLCNAGFHEVMFDLSVCGGLLCDRLGKTESLDTMAAMLVQCKRQGVNMPVAYAPAVSIGAGQSGSKGAVHKEQIIPLIEQSIVLAAQAGCHSMIICPREGGASPEEEWKANREYYLHFAQIAQENDIRILLKNQCRSINGHLIRGLCSDAVIAAEWIDRLNAEIGEERFGFCMDTAVHNICGQNMQEFAGILKHRVKAVILRDCDGSEENALLPFSCVRKGQSQTDWQSLIRGLRAIAFDGELILDISGTAQSFSPLLRPELLRFAHSVADFFQWQIELENHLKEYPSIVLFGAGNMCRNYMKCYGEQYPPLFTCDNNADLWGSSFAGLEVRNPESLKEIPKDCVVLICNLYYREIQQQLRDMGIQNRIEFFNDEYMPSYYYDRVERM